MSRLPRIIKNRINMAFYFFRRRMMIRRYKGGAVSILSNNCVGALMCHDVGIQFNTPTVNLWMTCDDFLDYIENIQEFNKVHVSEVKNAASESPVGILGGRVTINFTHYRDFNQARDAWNRRKARVDMNNLFVVMSDNSDISDASIERFKKLPYRKIMFVNSMRKAELLGTCGFYARGDFSKGFNISDFWGLTGKRFYYQFDFISWLNGKAMATA